MMSYIGVNTLALIFTLFLALNAFVGANESVQCDRRGSEFCPQMKLELTLPGSAEEINALCPEVTNRLECLHNHDEMCPDKPQKVFTPEQYETYSTLTGDICNKDSTLHKDFTESMACIKLTVMGLREICLRPVVKVQLRQAYIRYKESVGESTEAESVEDIRRYSCLNHFQDIACMLTKISDACGATAKSAVREVVIRSKFLKEQHCTKESVPELQHLVDNLQLSAEERSRMSELLTTYLSWEDK